MSDNNYTLFVGDLSIFCTEDDVREAFATYGEPLEVKIIRCEETKKNLSYGFVKFATSEAAMNAIEALNGTMLCGRPMRFTDTSSLAFQKHLTDLHSCLQDRLGLPTPSQRSRQSAIRQCILSAILSSRHVQLQPGS
jgi:RNA recognition motif-containing protein